MVDLQRLLDRLELSDLVVRYATAVDTQDWELLATCFTDDADVDYRLPGGRALRGATDVAAYLAGIYSNATRLQHYITNQVVTVSGDRADGTCYVLAQHVAKGMEGGARFLTGGKYHDVFQRTQDGWRIAERRAEGTWVSGNPAVLSTREGRE